MPIYIWTASSRIKRNEKIMYKSKLQQKEKYEYDDIVLVRRARRTLEKRSNGANEVLLL